LASRTVEVRAEGEQFDNGAEQRVIAVDAEHFDALACLTSIDARALAPALLDTAERMDGHRCPVAHNTDRLHAALAAYSACDDDASHDRAAAMLADAVRQLLR
jgi:hypothetical protein